MTTRFVPALLAALTACAPHLVRQAPFRLRPDSIERGDLRGPFTGRVVDADTDRPVAGALVYASWRFVSGFGLEAPAGWRENISSTDALGNYRVPRLDSGPGSPARLSDFHLVIYKRGYVAYRSDRRFEDFGPRSDFSQMGEKVELSRWRPEASHVRHLRYVGGGPTLAELTAWETGDAVAELAGEAPPVATGPAVPGAPTLPGATDNKLHAEKLLRPADVADKTGFEGGFDVGELADESTTSTYDSVHFQARGKPESFDVAMRVWKLEPADAQARYDRLISELPGATEKNELGDKSVRASTPAGDILGLAFLDKKRGWVVLLQCGSSQCRSPEVVLALARVVWERIEGGNL